MTGVTVPCGFYCQKCRMQVGDIRSHDDAYHGEPPDILQARRVVAEYDCRMSGHCWDVLELVGGGPVGIVCTRCGAHHAVAAETTSVGS